MPVSGAMGASAARRAKRRGHAVSEGHDARSERPEHGHGGSPRAAQCRCGHHANGARGEPHPLERGYGSKRSPEGESAADMQ
jgi:hypothetical protein